jgi:hypothetical protein
MCVVFVRVDERTSAALRCWLNLFVVWRMETVNGHGKRQDDSVKERITYMSLREWESSARFRAGLLILTLWSLSSFKKIFKYSVRTSRKTTHLTHHKD